MIDLHCHLDLYKNPLDILSEVEKRCEFLLAVTTSPRAWEKTSKIFNNAKCIHTALGLHPELVKDRINERGNLIYAIANVKIIGEVGIDGSKQNIESMPLQQEVFSDVVFESERCGGRVLSIHSRNAATAVLNILEKYANKSVSILHWFSGSVKELDRAISLGCWFSVNPAMLSGSKGKNLISKMPISKILPETDGPFTQDKRGNPYMPWETDIIMQQLAQIFRMDKSDVEQCMKENLNCLFYSHHTF